MIISAIVGDRMSIGIADVDIYTVVALGGWVACKKKLASDASTKRRYLRIKRYLGESTRLH